MAAGAWCARSSAGAQGGQLCHHLSQCIPCGLQYRCAHVLTLPPFPLQEMNAVMCLVVVSSHVMTLYWCPAGFNCAEAVNFGPPDWLPWGTYVADKYRREGRSATLSHDALLIALVGAAPDVSERLKREAEVRCTHAPDSAAARPLVCLAHACAGVGSARGVATTVVLQLHCSRVLMWCCRQRRQKG